MKRKLPFSLFILLCLDLCSCHVARYFTWNFADVKDQHRFASIPVQTGETTFNFTDAGQNIPLIVPPKYDPDREREDLAEFLSDNKTLAFLVIRRDTLLYEKYFDGYDDSSSFTSFSISKAFVSALTGIAIAEGYIKDVHQPVTDFIPELTRPGFEKITLEHLLNMRSGIRFGEGYMNPFGEMARYYYGRDLSRYITKLKIRQEPDVAYDYISANTLLLGLAVERATGRKLNTYLEEKLWKPLGMEHSAAWNVDSRKHGTIKMFCCLNAIARDFARFGRLYLRNGNWEGVQVVPEAWVTASTRVMNDSQDSQGYPYTYCWRVVNDHVFFAKGILGQYLYIDREKELVMVRLGKKYAGIDWADFCQALSGQL
jgi:CubicO group peptidase (beta-lactamase class C family)